MRLLLILSVVFFGTTPVFAQAKIHFETTVHKFPKTLAGDTLYFEYPFTNIGDDMLLISRGKVNCECTKVVWPKRPIPPDDVDTIKVWFSTAKAIGYQDREIHIIYNSPYSPTGLRFKGKVDNPAAK